VRALPDPAEPPASLWPESRIEIQMPSSNENESHVTCSSCGAIFDVAGIEPGSSFACEGCGATVNVPEPSEPRPSPVRRPRPTTRRRAAVRSPRDDEATSSRPIKLYAFLGVAAVVIIAAVLVIANLGGRDQDGSSPAPAEPAAGQPPAPRDATSLEKRYQELRQAAMSSNDPNQWYTLGEWCEENAYPDANRSAKIYKHIVRRLDADHERARNKLGYRRYTGDIEKYARVKWLTAEEMSKVRSAEKRAREHRERLESDRWYRAAQDIVEELKRDPDLSKFELEFTRYKPFLIAKQKRNPETDAFKNRILGEMLQAAARDFAETFKELGLKPLDEVEFKGKASVLPIVYFEDKISFERYHLAKGQEIPKGMAAYFMPSTNRIVCFEDRESRGAERDNINKLVHELVHQLVWFYTPSRTRCQFHFFQEGIAEFFSDTTRKPITNQNGERSFEYTFRGKLIGRMKHLKHCKQSHWFSFAELMKIETKADLDRECKRKAGEDEQQRASCGALFYAEAWSLFYFLWHHKDGMYRENLIKYVGMELDGQTGLTNFRRAFEGVNLKHVGNMWRSFVNSSGPFLKDL